MKSSTDEFRSHLNGQQIFCLQETKSEIKIPDYKCFNKLRSDSRSGGLCIGIHREYQHLVENIDTSQYPDIMAVRLSGDLLNGEEVILVNVYDSQDHSSYKLKKSRQGQPLETLTSLSCFLSTFMYGTPYVVVGDMNARIGNLHEPSRSRKHADTIDALVEGSFNNGSYNMTSIRNREDSTVNERGRKLLDFSAETNMEILNGSTVGDIFGRYTCLKYNGSSVVDYTLVSSNIRQFVDYFKVLNFTNISDHRPTICCFKANLLPKAKKVNVSFSELPPKHIWDQLRSPVEFLASQNTPDHISGCQNICSQVCNTKEDVKAANENLIGLLKNIANSSLQRKKPPTRKTKRRKPRKNPWFDKECIKSRISLRKACKKYCESPTDPDIRNSYYQERKSYRRFIKQKKRTYFNRLNKEIEENNNIKWEHFKKLKCHTLKQDDDMDLYNLASFYKFFKDLYAEKTLDDETVNHLKDETSVMQQNPPEEDIDNILNDEISYEELSRNINKLKKGKASAEDGIANEFIISAANNTKLAILKVFNECLKKGIYPWNTALITPLHKKGDKDNPNNYRAIAVGSNLGKLFSSILLERLIHFRSKYCPDTTNQLGFVKEAQTSDHIFTLRTCIEKYTKQKKRLYTCFVDYRKAFDTVCREALLYKLCKLGIKGNFFNCVKYMYQNSSAKLKLLNKISEAIDILIGTEQGHPMSPELFKTYLLDLSIDLNKVLGLDIPNLNGELISHLLWADDLVLIALDPKSLQTLINKVHQFCEQWGLSVNISKTAIMVFNKTGRQLQESHGFKYGSLTIPSARTYCYLGIVFNLNGSTTAATDELRKKGLKAYFALKSIINLGELSTKSVFKLFDALILPVVAYGCQTWLQETNFVKAVINGANRKVILQKLATDPLEKLHLRFLKWTLQVHKKCSNLACYGDAGRFPLVIQLTKQVISYFNRLQALDQARSNSLVRHAFAEQRTNKFTWYQNTIKIMEVAGHHHQTSSACPAHIKSKLQQYFNVLWETERHTSSKLSYYNQVKITPHVHYEDFLDLACGEDRKCLMRLRSSSHRLNCETGRYVTDKELTKSSGTKSWYKRCEFCTTEETKWLSNLPFCNIIQEDEHHVLISCPRYHQLRTELQEDTKSLLLRNEEHNKLYKEPHVNSFSRYVTRIFRERFPKKVENRQCV